MTIGACISCTPALVHLHVELRTASGDGMRTSSGCASERRSYCSSRAASFPPSSLGKGSLGMSTSQSPLSALDHLHVTSLDV